MVNVLDKAAPVALPDVPFVRASFVHTEPCDFDRSTLLTTNTVTMSGDVPAYGYLKNLYLYVQATGGTGAAAVYQEDAPWSAINEFALSDINGGQMVGPISGYDLYLINLLGGYDGWSDPALNAAYVTPATTGNFEFILRVPVEISDRDGVGALPNMNASSTYKFRIILSNLLGIYSTNPTGIPTVRIRVWFEGWAAPAGMIPGGGMPAMQPPAINTTQFWTKQVFNINAAAQTIRTQRVGNVIRNFIAIYRNATPARIATPDPLALYLDSALVYNEALGLRRTFMRQRVAGGTTLPTGVLLYDYTHDFDGFVGGESRDQWLKTQASTRLEWQGTFSAAGTLTLLTNDIAVVGNPYLG